MRFNTHPYVEGSHAFLSASKYHWVNYDEEKLDLSYVTYQAAQRGTALHEFAKNAIDLGVKLPRSRKTLNLYVNDAIGFRMKTEQVLFYSFNCFGTADTIGFRDNKLRIHDLKTGVIKKASMMQLKVYAAIFCLEYDFKPVEITTELRIYQNDDVWIEEPDPDELTHIMSQIISFDKRIERLKEVE